MAIKDLDREFLSIVELVEQFGAAQLADLTAAAGTKRKIAQDGYWRVEPGIPERMRGCTISLYPPAGDSMKVRFPKNGCTAQTLSILQRSLERLQFHPKQVEKELRLRAVQAEPGRAAQAERPKHLAASAAAKPKPAKRKPKVWPNRVLVTSDVDHVQAAKFLDDPGDGSLTARPMSETNVERFLAIHHNFMWVPSDFHFDWYGFCTNGRHRLEAIRRLGSNDEYAQWRAEATKRNMWPVTCHIIYGCDQKEYAVYDTPKTRSGGDTLVIKRLAGAGVNQNYMSSALKMLAAYKSPDGVPSGSWARSRIENSVVEALVERFPEIYDAQERAKVLHQGRRKGVARFMPTPAIAFCYLAAEAWPECGAALDQFMLAVTRCENLKARDPRKALYHLMISQGGPKRGDVVIPAPKQLALLIKMWNYWCIGRQVENATWRDDEAMPVPLTAGEVKLKL